MLAAMTAGQTQTADEARRAIESQLCTCACGEQGWACGAGASCQPVGRLGCVCEGFGRGECSPSASCIGTVATGEPTRSALICPARRAPTSEEQRILAEKVATAVAIQEQALSTMRWWNFGTSAAEVADMAGTAAQHGLSVMVPSVWLARFGVAAIRVGAAVVMLDAARGAIDYRKAALAGGADEADAALCALAGGTIGGLISLSGQNLPILSGEVDKLMRIGWRWLKSPVARREVIGFAAYTGMTGVNNLGQAIQQKLSDAAQSVFIGTLDFTPKPARKETRPVNFGGIGHRW